MSKVPLRDLIVVLPGITGSVLQQNGQDLWNISGRAFWEFLTTLGDNLQSLQVRDDGTDDGIRATSLISGIHLIPGLVKIDGYADLITMILKNFTATLGNIHEPNGQAISFRSPTIGGLTIGWRHTNSNAFLTGSFLCGASRVIKNTPRLLSLPTVWEDSSLATISKYCQASAIAVHSSPLAHPTAARSRRSGTWLTATKSCSSISLMWFAPSPQCTNSCRFTKSLSGRGPIIVSPS